jgi:hypothetical protein
MKSRNAPLSIAMFSNVIFLDIPKTITLILFSSFSPYLKLTEALIPHSAAGERNLSRV